ncbi:gluconate 2-dehydrogenase subunit 3 family protein [Desulforamulus aeronauticus]|uniref:Gluconate 2-dehydrogenase subunit 3 n=1 Tax=Desulforamulus aeronauticus DSM 10349 TaxID=1121421 RepID=A0A1M6NCF3_9FIRM|nr:gluconate 2-dehydrogenase subunit 3 family protein [Desulforamulus aeronauticus]SHJ93284.1 Gluconate 2-dehydrogenase subunit 3 [Desulforamulus aeronauticus DSM 10349]
MQEKRTRYPSYDVLREQEHWDEHTREIVLKRLGPFDQHKFLEDHEAALVFGIARHIVYDHRKEILDYVVHHLDQSLSSAAGEDQRKVDTPEQRSLVRDGLRAIDKLSQKQYGAPFLEIDEKEQYTLLQELDQGKALPMRTWQRIPQQELFKKLATEIISAYYSHPVVWSEIGYGGPAYPRGYVRIEQGLTDPWEAKRDVNK